MTARWPTNRLITNDHIQPGDVIVGLSSSGKSTYETEYNSGIGSNGLTSARHDVLSKHYAEKYAETFEQSLDEQVVYIGKHTLTDKINVEGFDTDIGKLILSPTRTYAPVVTELLTRHFADIHGLVHCSGGGQTKCMKYLPGNIKVI